MARRTYERTKETVSTFAFENPLQFRVTGLAVLHAQFRKLEKLSKCPSTTKWREAFFDEVCGFGGVSITLM